ncbi:hypothetical protein EO087_14535 [Dyella sp. M7H15-1]|nr:hypothetical protein EO087_14535 [Dyella sp. M7H15-1]
MALAVPQRKQGDSLAMRVVVVEEIDPPASVEPLHGMLLTSEPVGTVQQVQDVVRFYTLRWRIEEFHKAWKSGAGVERQRLQSADNLERMLAITRQGFAEGCLLGWVGVAPHQRSYASVSTNLVGYLQCSGWHGEDQEHSTSPSVRYLPDIAHTCFLSADASRADWNARVVDASRLDCCRIHVSCHVTNG